MISLRIILKKLYKEWLNFVADACGEVFEDQDANRKKIPIVVHGYAYVVPDGRGLLLVKDNWLKKKFRAKGHRDLAQNTKTMTMLIDEFNRVLFELAESFDNVHYVDLRETLSSDLKRKNGKRKYKEDWGDEIHPTNEGFAKVAVELSKEIDRVS